MSAPSGAESANGADRAKGTAAARWAVDVQRSRCCGAGQCALAAPEVFDQAEDGLVLLLTEHPPAESLDRVRTAAYDCPSRAISVRALR